MENHKYPISTEYFCGNCEDEFTGFPAGSRSLSGRPLCLRCTQIGVDEGWAEAQIHQTDRRIYQSSRKPGIMVLSFFLAVLFVMCWAVGLALWGPDRSR